MQTSIDPKGQPVAFAGLIADSSEVDDVVSGFLEEVSASAPFGIGIAQGVQPQGGLLPAGSGDSIKGIVAHSFTHAPGTFGDLSASGIVGLGGRLRIMRHGRIWVLLDPSQGAISPYVDRAFCRYSANGGDTQVGAFRTANDAGHSIDLSKLALFVSPLVTLADGTKIAKLEVTFTVKP